MRDCYFIRNEYYIAEVIRVKTQALSLSQPKGMLLPIAFAQSHSRCMLLSPFMNKRDAWWHLIGVHANIFSLIDETSLLQSSNEGVDERLSVQ